MAQTPKRPPIEVLKVGVGSGGGAIQECDAIKYDAFWAASGPIALMLIWPRKPRTHPRLVGRVVGRTTLPDRIARHAYIVRAFPDKNKGRHKAPRCFRRSDRTSLKRLAWRKSIGTTGKQYASITLIKWRRWLLKSSRLQNSERRN